MSRPLACLLEDLLSAVAADCPAAIAAMTDRCAGLSVEARVSDEALWVEVTARGPRVRSTETPARTRVASTLETVRSLVTGEREVTRCLRDDSLRLWGDAEWLARLDDFVRLLVAGAARATGAGALLDEFLHGGRRGS